MLSVSLGEMGEMSDPLSIMTDGTCVSLHKDLEDFTLSSLTNRVSTLLPE